MTGEAQVRLLGDGRRLHFNHGPIDIVALAEGDEAEVQAAYVQGDARFSSILEELVAELPRLRAPVEEVRPVLNGAVAQRMASAVWPHRGSFVTPMAAVAGAVADEVLAALVEGRDLKRVYVNNGGDIAFYLAPGQSFDAGIVDDADAPALDARVGLMYDMPVRGLATSGWRGRSHSLGIADAVTVLAECTAVADVAATLIANEVNVDQALIERAPASALSDDSDLGDLLVTVAVGELPAEAVEQALAAGLACANAMLDAGLLFSAYLSLQGRVKMAGADARLSAVGGAK
ncbi:MAG: UPF0280 family protein [Rhodospirillaceae bacterium]|nr:UPF0280 family protein [Rhodospirillaceae bacterium]MBT7292657.1 UPF0280 family protein [Rhodospirillaceae bacterium]